MRTPLGSLIVGVCVLAMMPGCQEAPAQAELPPPRVTVQHPVQRPTIDYNEYNGWTDASKTVEVRSRVRGHIQDVPFTDGDIVEEGQLLFQLDPRPFQADVDAAMQQVEVNQASLDYAKSEEERDQALFDKKAITKAELQRTIASRKSWDAKVAASKEEVKRKALELEYASIVAPMKGKISRAMLDRGNLVDAGGTDPLLTTIVALDEIFVYFFVDERALLEYRDRNGVAKKRSHEKPLKHAKIPFDFGLETDRGFPNHGTLDFANNRIDPKTGTIEVRGFIKNDNAKFLPGSRVRVRIPISDKYPAILVPDTAILSDQSLRYVLTLNAENNVVRRNVALGRLMEDGLRVVLPAQSDQEGIKADDWVIVDGLQRARLNYPVEPMDADGKPITK